MSELFIDDYVNKIIFLEERIGDRVGYKPMEPFWSPGMSFRDPLRLQGAAKELANVIGLGQYTFLITPTKQEKNTAGRIELRYSGNEVFVEISDDVQGFEDAVVATLAHELTHKYMQINGISIGTGKLREYENEVLTDITTVFLGLGKFLLNGCDNRRTYEERRGGERYEVTRTMKVGYLTRKQLAFVYRLVCSMRGVSREDMLSNLNWDAKEAVIDCRCYSDEYFNSDFGTDDYRNRIEDVTSGQLAQLQSKLDELEEDISHVDSKIGQLRNAIQTARQKAVALRDEAGIIKSSGYDPCMKYLECIKIEQWKNYMASTVSEKLAELDRLHRILRRLGRFLGKEAKEPDKKRGRWPIFLAAALTILLIFLYWAFFMSER